MATNDDDQCQALPQEVVAKFDEMDFLQEYSALLDQIFELNQNQYDVLKGILVQSNTPEEFDYTVQRTIKKVLIDEYNRLTEEEKIEHYIKEHEPEIKYRSPKKKRKTGDGSELQKGVHICGYKACSKSTSKSFDLNDRLYCSEKHMNDAIPKK